MTRPTTTVTAIRLSHDLKAALRLYAEDTGQTVTGLLRLLAEQHLVAVGRWPVTAVDAEE